MKILYIDIDSLNPGHLGCYGYPRPTSPTIDAIAAEGLRFSRAYCSDSPCGPSRAATFSGQYGIVNGVVTHTGRGSKLRDRAAFGAGAADARERPLLAEHIHAAGLPPITFSSFAPRHRFWWFGAGWAEQHGPLFGRNGNERADEVNAHVLPWLRDRGAGDWFLHVHYWDPHRNYRCPQSLIDRFAAMPRAPWPDAATLAAQQHLTAPFTPGGLYPWVRTPQMPADLRTPADLNRFISGYDASIRFCDDRINEVVAQLQADGSWSQTWVIVTSDHGEHMGGQGIYGDHPTAFEEGQRVPLIIRPPGGMAGAVTDALTVGLDLAPTISEILEQPVPTRWHGRSLLPLLTDPARSWRDHLVLTHGLYTAQRAVVQGDWKLLKTAHSGLYDFAPTRLHHLPTDPHEEQDLSSQNPERIAALEGLLADFIARYCPGEDPLQWVIEDGPYKHITPADWAARGPGPAPVEPFVPRV